MLAAAIVPGVLIGAALGLLGGGGSVLTVPIFVYALGFSPKEAIAMSLAVVGTTSLVGAVGHWRDGHVNVRVASIFGAVAIVGTYLGTRLATRLSGAEQEQAINTYSHRSHARGAGQWTASDVSAPASHRLYRATASKHFLLGADDRRMTVRLDH